MAPSTRRRRRCVTRPRSGGQDRGRPRLPRPIGSVPSRLIGDVGGPMLGVRARCRLRWSTSQCGTGQQLAVSLKTVGEPIAKLAFSNPGRWRRSAVDGPQSRLPTSAAFPARRLRKRQTTTDAVGGAPSPAGATPDRSALREIESVAFVRVWCLFAFGKARFDRSPAWVSGRRQPQSSLEEVEMTTVSSANEPSLDDVASLWQEIERYLAAVDVFCALGCQPTWWCEPEGTPDSVTVS